MANVENPITAEITALRRAKPKTAAEARKRATELCKLEGILHDAARRVVDARVETEGSAPKRNGGGAKVDGSRAVTGDELNAVIDVIAKAGADDRARLDALEVAQKDMLTDGDIWREATLYRRGAQVTHDGTIWVAKEANSRARPGQSNNCWRMQVKTKGR